MAKNKIASPQGIRAGKLALRDGLSKIERVAKSGAMLTNLVTVSEYAKAQSMLYFVNFRSEIITMPGILAVLADGVTLCLPLTIAKPPQLQAYQVTNLDTDLQSGYCNILEPNPKRCAAFDPARLDVVIVPGSVFDRRGGRMGYGGGYYDRFLADLAPQATRIGVCFELQVEEYIPLEPHDQFLDFIVTEDCVYKCFRGK
jgi:5-formyltetrahydrofolate cyclo-ligase